MQKLIKLAVIVSISVLAFSSKPAQAAVSPLSISIVPPLEFPPDDFTITGLRASVFWGEQRSVYGFDVGLIGNITQNNFGGLAVSGLFNINRGNTTIVGLQAAGAANVNTQKTSVVGFQIAAVNSNTAESSVLGFEIGAIANLAPHTNIYGAQIGLYNKANEIYGFQIGVLNFATSVHGLQIGLLNFQEKGLFAVCPIINFGF